jgi:uncharacterized protein
MKQPIHQTDLNLSPEDIGFNESPNEHFSTVLAARLSRRNLLRGGFVSATGVLLGSLGLAGCGSSDSVTPVLPIQIEPFVPNERLLSFSAISKSLLDSVIVPTGYTATAIYALGDPLNATTTAFKNDGSNADFENRAGDHHDGMEWFGLAADGKASSTAVERGLLVVNHEATTDELRSSFFLHVDGGTSSLPRPALEVDKEIAIHGVSVVEVRKVGSKWETVNASNFNRRITPLTSIDFSGPARASTLLRTRFSPAGLSVRGTINNCGTGKTPWSSFVTGEENFNGYYTRAATDDTARADKSVVALRRYGRNAGSASRHGWETAGSDEKYTHFLISKTGASVDGIDDYRNEMNGQGYIVEIDPYDKTKAAKKRTAMGRFAHESAAFSRPVVGQQLAVYMGDDARNEYIYKWVSTATWDAADATPSNALSTGDKYLDSGKLYVAKLSSDSTGTWIELNVSNPLIASYTTYSFADQADVCINARLAGDAVGATKMDRPEWCSVNPANGEIFFTLTNNSNRRVEPGAAPQLAPDAANPRAYTDFKGTTAQNGNPNGHILRIKETTNAASTSFTWDIYLFGAESGADASKVNLSGLTNDQDFSSPDGLVFSRSTGICWIQTDDGAYTDVTNCMMLAGLPGTVGDGKKISLNYDRATGGALTVDTYVGKAATTDTLKRFLVGPVGCEITGLCETPDGKAMFINIQHPGETTLQANIADPTKYTSQWPSNAGFGAGKRPRSATIVITKNDGGRIGS